MHYRNNDDCSVFYRVINAKWKAMNDGTSCIPMNDWVQGWSFRDARKYRQNLIKELVTQTLPLLLVPGCRIR
jgi:hypothetical protein